MDYIAAFYGCLMRRGGGARLPAAYEPQHAAARIHPRRRGPRAVLTTEAVYRQLSRRFDESPHPQAPRVGHHRRSVHEEADGWFDPNVGPDTGLPQYTSASTSKPKA